MRRGLASPFLLLGTSLTVLGENSLGDGVGLVQKALASTGTALNHSAATDMLVKLSGLVRMIDHDLSRAESDDNVLEMLFECTRGAGLPTADKVIGLTNGIASMRGNCKDQNDGKSRRACAKDVTGFLGDTLGLIMTLPTLPASCFLQDCSSKDNFNHKVSPVLTAAGGVETLLGLMTAIGNVDASCISKETTSIAATDDAHLRYPTWLYWVMKPFDLLSTAYDVGVLASAKENKEFHYSICSNIAGFTGSALGLMEALFDVKSHAEGKALGEAGQSAQWGCASGLTKMISTLPGVIGIACGYESCKDGEQVAEALRKSWG